jgi:hypothetical protein
MKILHVVQEAEDLTGTVQRFIDLIDEGHVQEVVCLAERDRDEGFDARLLEALVASDRVICW